MDKDSNEFKQNYLHQLMLTTVKKRVELDLTNLLKAIAYWEITLENIKIQIAENHDFDIYYAYNLISNSKNRYIDAEKLHIFLSANRITCSTKECRLIWQQIFQNAEQVTSQEFCRAILPQTNEQLRDYFLNKRETQPNQHSQLFIRDCLIDIFEAILQSHRQVSHLSHTLLSRPPLSKDSHQLWRIITELDSTQSITGHIVKPQLIKFIEKNGAHFSNDEWEALLRIIGHQPDRDHITQSEFNHLIQPPRNPIVVNRFNSDQMEEKVREKMQQFGFKPVEVDHSNDKTVKNGFFNFRKVFDPVREGRPEFHYDEKYLRQLRDYKERYVAPSKNQDIHYRPDIYDIRYHDSFFQDYYLHLHDRDKEEIFFNRFGKKYVYERKGNSGKKGEKKE